MAYDVIGKMNQLATEVANLFRGFTSWQDLSYSASTALDFSKSNFKMTLSGNLTLNAPSNLDNKTKSGLIVLTQDATGGRTLTLDIVWKMIGSDDADTSPNRKNIYSYAVIDSNTILIQFLKAV